MILTNNNYTMLSVLFWLFIGIPLILTFMGFLMEGTGEIIDFFRDV